MRLGTNSIIECAWANFSVFGTSGVFGGLSGDTIFTTRGQRTDKSPTLVTQENSGQKIIFAFDTNSNALGAIGSTELCHKAN